MLFGAAVGALLGLAQGLVLRPHVARWPAWIWTNALGWGLGLPFTFLAARTVPTSPTDAALSGAWAGLAMGLCVGVVTSLALLKFAKPEALDRPSPQKGPWALADVMRLDAAGGRLDASFGTADQSNPPNATGQIISLDGPFEGRPPFQQK